MRMLEEKITSPLTQAAVLIQAIYVIVNVAIGNEKHKGTIMNSVALLESIVKHMVNII